MELDSTKTESWKGDLENNDRYKQRESEQYSSWKQKIFDATGEEYSMVKWDRVFGLFWS